MSEPIRDPYTDLRGYRPSLDPESPPRLGWIASVLLMAGAVVVFVLGVAVGSAFGAPVAQQVAPEPFRTEVEATLPCLELQVRVLGRDGLPRGLIMLPLSRATIRAELWIRRHADHRQLSLAWDGGMAGGGGSAWQLHGKDEERYVFARELKDTPAANWFFVAAVFDAQGKLTGRQTASILMPERGQ